MFLKSLAVDQLHFDNRFIRELPADSTTGNFPRQVLAACYSRVKLKPVPNPRLISYSTSAATLLNLSETSCESALFTDVFSGNVLLPGMDPYAQCYGGHQFGIWAGQLGDGRAINLGEVLDRQSQHQTLQLKGSGATPYARNADGLSTLRSSIREYLCSEAMYHLGIPTTRALSLILTGEPVTRAVFYNHQPKTEPGAIICRIAPSFTRFGHFQLYAARGDISLLRKFADFTLRNDFPHLDTPCKNTYLEWFQDVCRRTADTIIHWQRVGFVHGVMNTDNMSILGLTLDYGPYGWLEEYNTKWTANPSDATERRYRFGNQAQIGLWNLGQLANAIYPLVETPELLRQALSDYSSYYEQGWHAMMLEKLGLKPLSSKQDKQLIAELVEVLQLVETDMSLFFRNLALLDCLTPNLNTVNDDTLLAPMLSAYYHPDKIMPAFKARIADWIRCYRQRVTQEKGDDKLRRKNMNSVNPKFIFRNYLAQQALELAEKGDFSMIQELQDVLRAPYDDQPNRQTYARKRPEWANLHPGCTRVSCSA